MDYFLNIAGAKIKITAPDFQPPEEYAAFSASACDMPDIRITCKKTYERPTANGAYLGSASDYAVFSDGKTVLRLFSGATDFAVLSAYPADSGGECEVTLPEKNYGALMGGNYFFGILSLFQLMLRRGTLFLHASYIEYNGKAVIFSAPSGVGKSTQAALWERRLGAGVINGDKCAVNMINGTAFAHGVPFAGTSGICNNRSLPLAAVVLLSQAERNEVRLLKGTNALAGVMRNVYLDFIDPNERGLALSALGDILSSVPAYSFACTKEDDAAAALFDFLCKTGDITAYGI